MFPDDYDREVNRITAEIGRLKILRDAQVNESVLWYEFQDRIDRLTRALIDWEHDVARARELDAEITLRERDLNRADREIEWAAGGYRRSGAFLASLGGVLLLLGLIDGMPGWMLLAAFAVLVAGCACAWAAIRAHRSATALADDRQREYRVARDERAALLPAEPERLESTPW